jgi:ribonuclease E
VNEPGETAPFSEPGFAPERAHREEAEPTEAVPVTAPLGSEANRSAREDRPIEIADREQPASRPRARSNSSSSEPVLERVVVTPDQTSSKEVSDTSGTSAPARKGWWQRKLGGE